MSGQEALQPLTPLTAAPAAVHKTGPLLHMGTAAAEWSKRTGHPKHLYSSSSEFTKKHGDMSKLDKYGRPTHTKDGGFILRFR